MPRSKFNVAMIPASTDGVNYYRLAAWAFEMRKYKGISVTLPWFKYEIDPARPHPWQEDMRSETPSWDLPGMTVGQYIKAVIDKACQVADVVVWHPMYYEWSFDFFLEMQHKHQKPFVLEVDDNYVDVPPWNEAFHSFKNGQAYRRIALDCMRNADAVVVTTPHLARAYSSLNDNIHVVENSLDFKGDRKFVGWDTVSPRKHKGIRLGWIGGRAHYNDLMMVAPVLREILLEHPDVTLCMVNSAIKLSCALMDKPYPFEGLKNVHYADRSVAINRYAAFMASFGYDIGIAPLVDCNFNRSKSNLRWLEYSALKIPTVATDISHFRESIEPNITGVLVTDNNLQAWKDAMKWLIEDAKVREMIGRAAYRKVKQDFNIERNAPKYLRLLRRIADAGSFSEMEEEAVAV